MMLARVPDARSLIHHPHGELVEPWATGAKPAPWFDKLTMRLRADSAMGPMVTAAVFGTARSPTLPTRGRVPIVARRCTISTSPLVGEDGRGMAPNSISEITP